MTLDQTPDHRRRTSITSRRVKLSTDTIAEQRAASSDLAETMILPLIKQDVTSDAASNKNSLIFMDNTAITELKDISNATACMKCFEHKTNKTKGEA